MKCEGFGCEEVAEDGTKLLGCDTIFAVNREHFAKNWQKITLTQELISIINSYKLPYSVDIVLTGGEPLIYANEELFVEFLEALHKRGHRICFETNGSLNVDFLKFPIYRECEFALSVKLKNSGEAEKKRINEEVLKSLTSKAKNCFFKFSIGKDSLGNELENELQNIIDIAPNTEVYCMPLGGSKEEVEENSEPLVEFCKTKGYNFSDRLHIRIWNKEKGV
jgi:organic radical activating enzyme